MKEAQKILVVDDDVQILRTYQRILSRKFDLDTAHGAEEALLKMRSSGPYAVVISDLQMPGTNGLALLRQVRKLSQTTICALLTGDDNHIGIAEANREGTVSQCILKPCPIPVLIETVQRLLNQSQVLGGSL